MNAWLNTVNTTSFRIVISVVVASLGMLMILAAMLFFNWQPTTIQVTVLGGLAFVALTREGFDVTQFASKRFSDARLATAKRGPSPVNVEAPSTVEVSTRDSGPPISPAEEATAIRIEQTSVAAVRDRTRRDRPAKDD